MTIAAKSVLLSLLLGGLFLFGCTASASTTISTPTPGASPSGSGQMVFVVKDAATNLGSVTSIQLTVDRVEVHSDTQGWVTTSSTAKTYDLMQLKASGSASLMAYTTLKAGTYDQTRLRVTQVTVVDANGSHEAKLPSNELKLMGSVVVTENATSSATFDFIADESLHVTGNGKYILTPVVQVETRSDVQVDASNQNDVRVNGGSLITNARLGMDVSGNMGVGLTLPADANLTINGDVIVVLSGSDGVLKLSGTAAGQGNGLAARANAALGVDADLRGKTFAQLQALNAPIECQVDREQFGATFHQTYRIQSSSVRLTTTSADAPQFNTDLLVRDGQTYMSTKNFPSQKPGCEWVESTGIDLDGVGVLFDDPAYNRPYCVRTTFDASVFSDSTKLCTP